MKEKEEVEDEEDYVALHENFFNFTNFITNTYHFHMYMLNGIFEHYFGCK